MRRNIVVGCAGRPSATSHRLGNSSSGRHQTSTVAAIFRLNTQANGLMAAFGGNGLSPDISESQGPELRLELAAPNPR